MDEAILRSILNNLDNHIKSVLATIVYTEGPTPRELGTHMLIMGSGQTIGTIGGGAVEKYIYQRALAIIAEESQVQAEIQNLQNDQEPAQAELPGCGGNLKVLLEPIGDRNIWQAALDIQGNGQDVALVTALYAPYFKGIVNFEGKLLAGEAINSECLAENLHQFGLTRQTQVLKINDEQSFLIEPFYQRERLLILGAGHVAREVAYYAKPLDFEITVIDDRAEYAKPGLFPEAHKVIQGEYISGIQNYCPDKDTYVVVATWSHQTDAACVKEILNYETKYVGMLGSARKVRAIVQKLEDEGNTAQNIARLRAPIGLNIRAQTPAEIALSIMAEIISVRRRQYVIQK